MIDPSVATTAQSILATVLGSGHRPPRRDRRPEFGKTGTTDNNGDAWFVGSNYEGDRLRLGRLPGLHRADGDRLRRRARRRRDLPRVSSPGDQRLRRHQAEREAGNDVMAWPTGRLGGHRADRDGSWRQRQHRRHGPATGGPDRRRQGAAAGGGARTRRRRRGAPTGGGGGPAGGIGAGLFSGPRPPPGATGGARRGLCSRPLLAATVRRAGRDSTGCRRRSSATAARRPW